MNLKYKMLCLTVFGASSLALASGKGAESITASSEATSKTDKSSEVARIRDLLTRIKSLEGGDNVEKNNEHGTTFSAELDSSGMRVSSSYLAGEFSVLYVDPVKGEVIVLKDKNNALVFDALERIWKKHNKKK